MAEIGLAASVIELTNTAFSVGKFLNETWLAYKNAPTEVLEIAHEVTLCYELMKPFGEQLKTSCVAYKPEFQQAVEWLVKNSTTRVTSIRGLVPRDGILDKGIMPKWNYVLKKRKIDEHRRSLKEVQHTFVFVRQMMLWQSTTPQSQAQASGATDISFAGASKHFPLTLLGQGTDETGQPVAFHAALVMKPLSPPDRISTDRRADEEVKKEYEGKERKDRTRLNLQEPPTYLKNLRQNPYFSPELLKLPTMRYKRTSRAEEEVKKGFVDDLRRREREKKSRSSIEEEEEEQVLEIPDDKEAIQDVNKLMASWFGPEDGNRRYMQRPSLAVPEETVPQYRSGGNSSSKSPSPRPSTSADASKSPKSPVSENYSASIASRPATIYDCDGCGKQIRGTRYECRSCEDYHLCKKCFNDPEVTIRLKHQHPKSYFTEIRN